MKYLAIVLVSAGLAACGAGRGKNAPPDPKAGAAGNAAVSSFDTAKLTADMDAFLATMGSGKMDSVAIKKVAADLGLTTRQLLMDTGTDSSYRNSQDPSVRAAAVQLKRFRDATGWTPDMMDSLKQAADALKAR